jgi:RNA polymerase sigma-70 factor (ECF subfamily)
MDRDLVKRAQGGDLGAFEALASLSHSRLYRVAFGILRDTDRAKDATQQALVEIWKHIRGLRDPEAYDAWSYRIVVRECMRDAKRGDERALDTEVETESPATAADPFRGVVHRDQLERGFRRISVEHRAILVMRYLLDLSYEDIAKALDISAGTVASRLSRALAAMRAELEADERTLPTLRQAQEVD